MKKLFISCPMKGRTEENIRRSMERMHKIAEIVFDQELEVIPTYIEDNPPENAKQAIWYLSKSIEMMAEADYFIGINCSSCFNGCNIERNVASYYGIPMYSVDTYRFMPDTLEVERELYNIKTTDVED